MNAPRPVREAFTLIELLIVVAIIGILSAIAVPNFLQAQTKAKIARSQNDIKVIYQAALLRWMEKGLWIVDGNDCDGSPECCFSGTWFGVRPSQVNVWDVSTGENHFSGQVYQPLTTPFAYLNSIPSDPFASGCFYSFEDGGCSNKVKGGGLLAAAGPDYDNGDWHGTNGWVHYMPSNGIGSNGDIWLAWNFKTGEPDMRSNPHFR